MCRNLIVRATIHVTTGRKGSDSGVNRRAHTGVQAHAIMEIEQTEEEMILAFMVSDEALETPRTQTSHSETVQTPVLAPCPVDRWRRGRGPQLTLNMTYINACVLLSNPHNLG